MLLYRETQGRLMLVSAYSNGALVLVLVSGRIRQSTLDVNNLE